LLFAFPAAQLKDLRAEFATLNKAVQARQAAAPPAPPPTPKPAAHAPPPKPAAPKPVAAAH
jgi:hypothetical protein